MQRIMIHNRTLCTMALLAVAALGLPRIEGVRNVALQVSEVAHYYSQLEEAHPNLSRWQRLLLSLTMSASQKPQPEQSGDASPERSDAA